MRKISILPFAALIMGIVGAVLRSLELDSAFDPITGLADPKNTVSIALIVLSILLGIAFLVISFLTTRTREVPENFKKAFCTRSYLSFALMAILGLVLIVCAIICAFDGPIMELTGYVRWVFIAFIALAGLGYTSMAYIAYTQRESTLLRLWSVQPSILYCFWMVALYRINAGNPVLLDYCYGCTAFAAAAMSAYYTAGYVYGRRNLGASMFVSLVAIYLLTVTLVDPYPFALRLMIAATALYTTQSTAHLLSSLTDKSRQQEAQE